MAFPQIPEVVRLQRSQHPVGKVRIFRDEAFSTSE